MKELSGKFIRWPRGQEANITVQKFNCLRPNAFPGVLGAVDGCHISIPLPLGKKDCYGKT